jgi:hypothetical protein
MKIILINGKARSGKDTLASLIKGQLPNKKVLIRGNAQTVKDCAKKYFNWNGTKDTKGRQLLIDITNLGYAQDPYHWDRLTLKYALDKDNYDYLIIPDWRYFSTYEYLKEEGYEVITVHRHREIDNELHHSLKSDISEQGFNIVYDFEVRGDIMSSPSIIKAIVEKI